MTDNIKVLTRDEVKQKAEHAYCEYIGIMRTAPCLGFEAKIASGNFGRSELAQHNLASEWLGKHRAYIEILRRMDEFEDPAPKKDPVPVTAIWLRRIGLYAEVLFEVDGKFRVGIREVYDNNFSHILESAGMKSLEMCPLDTLMDESKQPAPKREPGMVVMLPNLCLYRLDSHKYDDIWWVTCFSSGEQFITNISRGKVHRRKDEFKKGDWFATENNLVRRVAEDCGDGSIVDEVGVQRLTSEIRHVPPPKEEKPTIKRWAAGEIAVVPPVEDGLHWREINEPAANKTWASISADCPDAERYARDIAAMIECARPIPTGSKEEKPAQEMKGVTPNAARTNERVSKDVVTGASPSGANETGRDDEICNLLGLLKSAWRDHPDQRLGQFISNLLGPGKHDVFYVEDAKWRELLAHRADETSEKPAVMADNTLQQARLQLYLDDERAAVKRLRATLEYALYYFADIESKFKSVGWHGAEEEAGLLKVVIRRALNGKPTNVEIPKTSEKPYWDSQALSDVPATLNSAMERTADLNRRLKKLEKTEIECNPSLKKLGTIMMRGILTALDDAREILAKAKELK